MTRDLVIVGGGEHARVVIDAALSSGTLWNVLGYADTHENGETYARFGLRWLGTDHECPRAFPNATFVYAIGRTCPSLRERLTGTYAGCSFGAVVHRAATVAQTARLAPGVVVLARAVVNTGASIGAHAILNSASVVEHDVEIGPWVHVAPGAVIGGGARVEDGAMIGLGACIRDHICIGAGARVGMGAVVVADVAPGQTVIGVPAHPYGR